MKVLTHVEEAKNNTFCEFFLENEKSNHNKKFGKRK